MGNLPGGIHRIERRFVVQNQTAEFRQKSVVFLPGRA